MSQHSLLLHVPDKPTGSSIMLLDNPQDSLEIFSNFDLDERGIPFESPRFSDTVSELIHAVRVAPTLVILGSRVSHRCITFGRSNQSLISACSFLSSFCHLWTQKTGILNLRTPAYTRAMAYGPSMQPAPDSTTFPVASSNNLGQS